MGILGRTQIGILGSRRVIVVSPLTQAPPPPAATKYGASASNRLADKPVARRVDAGG